MKLEDYALIGDCETAALVGSNGSIDWLCWPDFSSPSCFAALLGTRRNGRWRIAPKERPLKVTRKYRDNTLVLETTFETSSGIVVLTDFMPIRERHSDVVRIVRCIQGRVGMEMELCVRFDYGGQLHDKEAHVRSISAFIQRKFNARRSEILRTALCEVVAGSDGMKEVYGRMFFGHRSSDITSYADAVSEPG